MQLITKDGGSLEAGDFTYYGIPCCPGYKIYEGRSLIAHAFLSMCDCEFCSTIRSDEEERGTTFAEATAHRFLDPNTPITHATQVSCEEYARIASEEDWARSCSEMIRRERQQIYRDLCLSPCTDEVLRKRRTELGDAL